MPPAQDKECDRITLLSRQPLGAVKDVMELLRIHLGGLDIKKYIMTLPEEEHRVLGRLTSKGEHE